MHISVIGGGLIGLATALALKEQAPHLAVTLLEKEPAVGRHQSTHNSGVLHAGLYYKPGSLKARFAVDGIRRMTRYCERHGIAHDICGKLVVATSPDELPRLKTLLERGTANGLRGLRWLERDALREIEPHAAGIAAVHVPEEGIVDYAAVCAAMVADLETLGVSVKTGHEVRGVVADGSRQRILSPAGDLVTDYIINCAGLHCDRVARSAGEPTDLRIVPFRGEYYQLRPEAAHLVRNLIYPVPDPTFPFLGVHFTRLIHGGVEAGPNAVLALAREGYTKSKIVPRDVVDALGFRGLWAFMRTHREMAWQEVRRSFSKRLFCASLQRLVPAITEADLQPGGAGVRAQAMLPDGTLVQDFHLVARPRALHLLNAPSPGATASLAIGEHVALSALNAAGITATATPQTVG